MADTKKPTDEELRQRLSQEQYDITQCSGTEAPFTGIYWDCKDDGIYRCIVCTTPLFKSETKFDSGTGWPSFWEPVDEAAVKYADDYSKGGRLRIEVLCASCGAHLGHRFPDGPEPTGLRFCINSAALDLERE